jgi:hypothetical protein
VLQLQLAYERTTIGARIQSETAAVESARRAAAEESARFDDAARRLKKQLIEQIRIAQKTHEDCTERVRVARTQVPWRGRG